MADGDTKPSEANGKCDHRGEQESESEKHNPANSGKLNQHMSYSNILTLIFTALLVVSAFLTFGVICVQALIYGFQLREMRKATQAATKAAKAAETSVEQARVTARLDQRAWITVRSVTMKTALTVGTLPIIEVRIENTGRTPALNVQSSGAVFNRETVQPDTLAVPSRPIVGQAGRSIIPPNAGETGIYYGKEPIANDEQIQKIIGEAWVIYVSGKIFYDDIFGDHHHTTFCYELSGREAPALRFSAYFDGNAAD